MTAFDYKTAIKDLTYMLSIQEAEALQRHFGAIRPKVIVELGAHTGCSSTVLANIAKENNGHLFSVEPAPMDIWYTNLTHLGLIEYATLIKAYSPWLSHEQMELIPKPIDCLFIDSEHTIKACITDYQFWQHYVRKGGRIAFHDWCGDGGVADQIQKAIGIILLFDPLRRLELIEAPLMGTIIFEKTWD